MLFNYFKLSFRLMARNPFFTLLKVGGIAVGLSMFVILWQYAQNELASDHQWKDSERIYRLGIIGKWTDDKINWQQTEFATSLVSLVDKIIPAYPEVLEVTRILSQQNVSGLKKEKSHVSDHGTDLFLSVQSDTHKKSFKEMNVVYGDPNLFRFFGIPLIEGQAESVLKLAGSIVVSEKLAKKYFGNTHATGKTILINDQISLMITGVFKDLPHNTHLLFDAVISTERIQDRYHLVTQDVHAPVHYLKVKDGIDISKLIMDININKHEQIVQAYWGDSPYGTAEAFLQPLSEMPFQSYVVDNYTMKSKFVLIVFKSTAIAILLLAWINYVNLSCASNLNRMKEVATVRLPMEALFGIYILPWSNLVQSSIWILLPVLITGALLTAFYLAWIVVRRKPKELFAMAPRQTEIPATFFTTFQYSVSITIVVFAFVIKGQINFVLSQDIGFRKEELVVVDLPLHHTVNFKADLNTFLGKVRENGASVSQSVPGDDNPGFINLTQPGIGAGIGVECNGGVDENYMPLYNIKMIEGRNFLGDNPADSTAILLSEITTTRLGFKNPSDAIGRKLITGPDGDVSVTIVGVFADYKTRPLLNMGYYQSNGLALTYKDYLLPEEAWSIPQKVSFRIKPEMFKESIAKIEISYYDSFSDPLFSWRFLDEALKSKYQQHIIVSNQVTLFSFLSIGIVCIGLLGMMVYKVHRKLKEISIRKIFGARLHEIAKILLNATMRQLLVATAVGVPLSYYLTQQYLQKFSERIQLEWWHLATPIAILATVMLSVIASIVWKAAKNNPVEALKHE